MGEKKKEGILDITVLGDDELDLISELVPKKEERPKHCRSSRKMVYCYVKKCSECIL